MITIKVHRPTGELGWQGKFETEDAAQAWIDDCLQNNYWCEGADVRLTTDKTLKKKLDWNKSSVLARLTKAYFG